ncbi:MAG: DUF559 domain-containing protein [Solirubrobacterales bacterium]|nr:DUF559 domain-containing protein [Solirubrobacterales bacterium]
MVLTSDCVAQTELRSRSFKGRGELVKLLQVWSPDTGRIRSVLEGEFLMLCGKHGIPAPRTNQRVGGYEVDCLWPGSKLIVELDGRRFHDDGFAIPADRAKEKALESRGFTVLRFTNWAVTKQASEVAKAVKAELEAA